MEERIYTIPLRAAKRAPRWKRANRAIKEVYIFLSRHTKTDPEMIKLDKSINEKIWERGIQKPPSRIRVRAVKLEDGTVEAELVGE
ncbi:50S ribosomal protein L31e [Methanosarcinales archaeon]|jgi:large subunit ribosomal protein L31e|nr:MAG: 50S ribosomal protein L31e [Methanosarcinales archaeon]